MMKKIRKYKSSAKKKNMNKPTIATILTLIVCFSAFAQEAKGKDWTEEEWKKEKGRYGWVFPHIDKNADGKVTAAEYEEFQKYKKKHPNWEMELNPNARPEGKTPTPKKGGSGTPAWVGDRFSTDIPEYQADQPLELLSPEA